MFKLHLAPEVQSVLFDKLIEHKTNRQKSQVASSTDLQLGDAFLKNALRVYLPKSYHDTDGKYDTTCLKVIMNNCKIFTGWAYPHGDKRGWFQ